MVFPIRGTMKFWGIKIPKFIFTESPKGLWPGASKDLVAARLAEVKWPYKYRDATIQQVDHGQRPKVKGCPSNLTSTPFIFFLGTMVGRFKSIQFCERAFRDHLRNTTRLGNLWYAFRYITGLIFFGGIVVFSGGTNPNLRILEVLQIFGVWLIIDTAFNRSVVSVFKYGKIEKELGISSRIIVTTMFTSTWIETLSLLILLNIWSLIDLGKLIVFGDYMNILFSITLLALVFLPISYLVAIMSRENVDSRYVSPVIFRIITLSLPLFGQYHMEIETLSRILSYSPLTFPFSQIATIPYDTDKSLAIYIGFLVISLSILCIKPKASVKHWLVGGD